MANRSLVGQDLENTNHYRLTGQNTNVNQWGINRVNRRQFLRIVDIDGELDSEKCLLQTLQAENNFQVFPSLTQFSPPRTEMALDMPVVLASSNGVRLERHSSRICTGTLIRSHMSQY
jgi:hypothetical protein